MNENLPPLQDINLFASGAYVNVDNIPEFQKAKIVRISDCGVTITNAHYTDLVISGRSPARLYVDDVNNVTKIDTQKTISEAKPKGQKQELTYIFPSGEAFTISQFLEVNPGVDYSVAYLYIKSICEKIGEVAKIPGKKGKPALIYQLKK